MEKEITFDRKVFFEFGVERSLKFHVLKFRSVMGRLAAYQAEGYFKQTQGNFLESLQGLKATELIEHGSDFFWSSVHRIFNAFDAGNEMTEIINGIFLQNAFDSFFKFLPIGSRLAFKNYGDDQITFISLGISIESYLDQFVVLEKTEVNNLTYSYVVDISAKPSATINIDIHSVPYFQRVKMAIVANHTQVLFQRHQVLFESAYHYECNPSVYLGQLLYARLQPAFNIIRSGDDLLYEEIAKGLDFIVPLAKPGVSNHPSFASALLKRTIFLSLDLLDTSDIYLAECIIHEFSHCQLNKVQDTVLLTRTDLTKRYYYSPWRTDPRHLLGLIHGIYVFRCVIHFYQRLLLIPGSESDHEWIENRMILLLHQVLLAIRQVREDEIEPAGALLIEDIFNELTGIAMVIGVDLGSTPFEMISHQQTWLSANTSAEYIIR